MTDDLIPASPDDVASSLRYSLRFGSSGKPHGKRGRDDAAMLARWAAERLRMSGFVFFRRQPPPAPTHNCGERPEWHSRE